MKKALKLLGIIFGSMTLIIVLMFLFNLCPPDGPWPMPPWCGHKSFEPKFFETELIKKFNNRFTIHHGKEYFRVHIKEKYLKKTKK